ncbi:MAG: winged helix-turn-helix domain-containing protein, partial [Acidimicrobiia bacterium]
MTRSIEVDDEVWEALGRRAEPFIDIAPNAVLRRLLRLNGSTVAQRAVESPSVQPKPPSSPDQWCPSRSDDKSRKRTNRGKLPRGEKTPEKEFRLPIVQALMTMGGEGRIGDVLERVRVIMDSVLKPVDFKKTHTGAVRWSNTAQWERQCMVDEGLLDKDVPRGVWRLTRKGYSFAEEHGLSS